MNDEAEKAYESYPAREISTPRAAFMAGRASRDAEVADGHERRMRQFSIISELRRDLQVSEEFGQIASRACNELRAEHDSLREQIAARDALIESQERQIAALTGSIQDINTGWDKTLAQLADAHRIIGIVAGRDGGLSIREDELLAADGWRLVVERQVRDGGMKITAVPEYRKGAGQ